jgi:bacteriorhodopsin
LKKQIAACSQLPFAAQGPAEMSFSQLAKSSSIPEECVTVEILGSTGVGMQVVALIALFGSALLCIKEAHVVSSSPDKTNSVKLKFFSILAYISGISALAYFAMLSDQGWVAISGCRQFFYARAVDWAITIPLTVLFLGMIAEVDSVSIVAVMSSALLMVFSSYMGAVSIVASVKWFWFLFFLAFMAYVIYSLTRTFRQSVDASGQMCLVELYSRLTWIVVVTYSLYAIVWLFSQGFPSFSVTLEVVAYSLLDIINKVPHPPPPVASNISLALFSIASIISLALFSAACETHVLRRWFSPELSLAAKTG